MLKLSNLIDSHVNFGHELLKNSVSDICKDALENNIERILSINSNIFEFQKDIDLIKDFNFIDISLGHHPNNTLDIDFEKIKSLLAENIKKFKNRIVGIGETGLDYHYNIPKNNQIKSLEIHLEAASAYNLPCIIHMRDAEMDMIKILRKYSNKLDNILIHCFTGSEEFAKNCIDLGCFFSLSGIITFKNADDLRETIKILPIEKIVFETDSPYLTPDPLRGKINKPSYLKIIIKKYCEITSNDYISTCKISTDNYKKLFKIND